MAGPLGRLQAVIGIDSREFDTGLGRAQKSLTGFGRGADLAMGLAAGAVAGGLIGTLDAAREWETAFAGVKKTVDTTGLSAEQQAGAFAELEDGLRDLAKVIPITATELAGLAEAGGALGIARDDLVEFARVTAIIGTTTDVVAQDAATSLGKLGTVIGLTADDYDNFGATLVDLGNKGASFESEILETANRIAGAGKIVGLSADEILGWAAAIANVGIQPEAAGGSFERFSKTVQTAALLGGNKLDILAETAGMTSEAFTDLFAKDVNAALVSVIEGFGDLDAETYALRKGMLGFDDIRISAFFDKLTSSGENLTSSLGISATAWEENTAMMAEAERRFETLDSGMQLFWNRVNDVAITLGRTLMPVLRGTVEHVGNLVDIFGDALKAFPQVTNVVTPLVTALSGLMALKFGARFLTAMIPGGDMFAAGLSQSLGTPIGNVAKKLGLTFGRTFGLAAAASIAIILVDELRKVGAEVTRQQEAISGAPAFIEQGALELAEMKKQLDVVNKGIADLSIQRFTFGPWESVGEFFGLWKSVDQTRRDLIAQRDALNKGIADIEAGIRGAEADAAAREGLFGLFGLTPDKAMAAAAFDDIKRFLQGGVDAVADLAEGIGGVAPEVAGSFKDITTAIRTGFGNVKQALKGGDQQMIDPATRMSNMRNRLAQVAQKLNQAIQVGDPWAISYWTDAYAKQQSLLEGLQGAVGQTKGQVTATLRSMGINVDRIWGKVKRDTKRKSDDAADSAISAARRTARLVARAFQGLAPKAGAWGADVTRAFAAGLARRNALSAIEASATQVMASVQDFMRTGSPTKKGPGSKDGGPEGWGEKWGQLFGAGISKTNIDLAAALTPSRSRMPAMAMAGGGRDDGGGIHVHVHGNVYGGQPGLRQLADDIERAVRPTRRDRRRRRLAEG